MDDETRCGGCGSALSAEMIFCPECGTSRPVPTAGRLRGLMLGEQPPGPPDGEAGGASDGPSGGPSDGPSGDQAGDDSAYDEDEDLATAEPVNLFLFESQPTEPEPTFVADAATEAGGFRFEVVAHHSASGPLALQLIDDATVLFRPEEQLLQRYLVMVSASARGEAVAVECPARALLCSDRLVGVLLSPDGNGSQNPCFSVDLGAVSTITLVRTAKRFGGHRDVAVRLATNGSDAFDVSLSSAATETTGPATYGPPPQELEPRALFNRLVGTTINSMRSTRGVTDEWLDAAEHGHLYPEGDHLVAQLRPM